MAAGPLPRPGEVVRGVGRETRRMATKVHMPVSISHWCREVAVGEAVPPWPVQAAQESYGQVFRQLLRLKRAEHGLRDLWLELQSASRARGTAFSGVSSYCRSAVYGSAPTSPHPVCHTQFVNTGEIQMSCNTALSAGYDAKQSEKSRNYGIEIGFY